MSDTLHFSQDEIREIRADMSDIRESVSKIADAMTRLAVLEERGVTANQLLQRVIDRQESLEDKLHQQELILAANDTIRHRLEVAENDVEMLKQREAALSASIRTGSTMIKSSWTVFGGIIAYLFIKLMTLPDVPALTGH